MWFSEPSMGASQTGPLMKQDKDQDRKQSSVQNQNLNPTVPVWECWEAVLLSIGQLRPLQTNDEHMTLRSHDWLHVC